MTYILMFRHRERPHRSRFDYEISILVYHVLQPFVVRYTIQIYEKNPAFLADQVGELKGSHEHHST